MPSVSWKQGADGSFTDPTAWDTGAVPGAGDTAVISVSGNYTVTLGATATVDALTIGDSAATLAVSGSGTLAVAGDVTDSGTITLDPQSDGASVTIGGDLTATGPIGVDTYENLYGGVGGATLIVTGTLSTAAPLYIGNGQLAASTTVDVGSLASLVNLFVTGTELSYSSAKAWLVLGATAAPGMLTTAIVLSGDAETDFGSGAIASIGSTGTLVLNGASAEVNVLGLPGDDSALALASNAGTLELDSGAQYATSGDFANTGAVTLDNGGYAGASLTVNGNFTNSGALGIDTYENLYVGAGGASFIVTGTLSTNSALSIGNAKLAASTTVRVGSLASLVNLAVAGNIASGTTAQASLDLGTTAAPPELDTSIVVLGDAQVNFGSGAITSIGSTGTLVLNGASADVNVTGSSGADSVLALSSNAGTLELDSGAGVATAGDFTNSGSITLDNGGYTGASLTVNGNLGNSGSLGVDTFANLNGVAGGAHLSVTGTLTNAGVFALSAIGNNATSTVALGALDNSGLFTIQGGTPGNTLDVTGDLIEDGGTLTVASGATLAASAVLVSGSGTLAAAGGAVSAPVTVETGGIVDVRQTGFAGAVTIAAGGGETIETGASASGAAIDGGTLLIANGGSVLSAVSFGSAGGMLAISGTTMATAEIDGFTSAGATIDLRNIGFSSSQPQPMLINNASQHNVLEVTGASGTQYDLQLDPSANYAATQFAAVADGGGTGTDISIACFGAGTLILTEAGEIPVEQLAIGDTVVTPSGARRPVRWIGHRHVACAMHPAPAAVWPYRVQEGAFGPGLPNRDLILSPDHCIAVPVIEGSNARVFVAVRTLENGCTIAQLPVSSTSYWHVELDGHDVLFANGLPVESYLDAGNRRSFDNGGAVQSLHPHFGSHTRPQACLPTANDGFFITLVRRRLLARAQALGWHEQEEPLDLQLRCNGVRVSAERSGDTFRFRVPASVTETRLVSARYVPLHHSDALADRRSLGVAVTKIRILDGARARDVPLTDPALERGFHAVEGEGAGAIRWTTGEAFLSPELWRPSKGEIVLEIGVVSRSCRRWIPAGVMLSPTPRCEAA